MNLQHTMVKLALNLGSNDKENLGGKKLRPGSGVTLPAWESAVGDLRWLEEQEELGSLGHRGYRLSTLQLP